MSYTASELVACPTLQSQLNDHFLTCDPQFIREPLPFFEFVMSSPNRGPLEQVVSPGNSKVRQVQLKYRQRLSESDVQSNQTNPTCTASTFRGDRWENYNIDTTVNEQVESKIPIAELIESCTSNEQYMAETIQMMINALERKIATKTAVQAVALNGRWGTLVDGVVADRLQVRTLRSGTTDELYPFAMEEIDMAIQQTGFCASPVIFGGSTLWKYARRMEKGCCADQGVDLGSLFAQYNKAFLYDYRIADALGGNDYNIAVMAGALQMITWNLFQGANGLNQIISDGTYSQRVINSPETGLPIDLMMKYDCGTLHIVMTATTKLVGLPNDMFPVDDIYQNVNFVSEIQVVNS